MIQRLLVMATFAMAFLLLSSYAYAQYGDEYNPGGYPPYDQYGNPICSYDSQGYPVYCNNGQGYGDEYYYYGYGPYWGREEEHRWGEEREHGRERGEHHEGGERYHGGEHR